MPGPHILGCQRTGPLSSCWGCAADALPGTLSPQLRGVLRQLLRDGLHPACGLAPAPSTLVRPELLPGGDRDKARRHLEELCHRGWLEVTPIRYGDRWEVLLRIRIGVHLEALLAWTAPRRPRSAVACAGRLPSGEDCPRQVLLSLGQDDSLDAPGDVYTDERGRLRGLCRSCARRYAEHGPPPTLEELAQLVRGQLEQAAGFGIRKMLLPRDSGLVLPPRKEGGRSRRRVPLLHALGGLDTLSYRQLRWMQRRQESADKRERKRLEQTWRDLACRVPVTPPRPGPVGVLSDAAAAETLKVSIEAVRAWRKLHQVPLSPHAVRLALEQLRNPPASSPPAATEEPDIERAWRCLGCNALQTTKAKPRKCWNCGKGSFVGKRPTPTATPTATAEPPAPPAAPAAKGSGKRQRSTPKARGARARKDSPPPA